MPAVETTTGRRAYTAARLETGKTLVRRPLEAELAPQDQLASTKIILGDRFSGRILEAASVNVKELKLGFRGCI